MSLRVVVPPHPLIMHWLSILRDNNTPPALFTTGFEQIGKWLTYEAIREWIPYRQETLQTDHGEITNNIIDPNYKIIAITTLIGGLNMWIGAKEVLPNSYLSIDKIPKDISSQSGIILYSGEISNGKKIIDNIEALKEINVNENRIRIISVIASSKGLTNLAEKYPSLTIYTTCIDEKINENNQIIPGIGNLDIRLTTICNEYQKIN